ncbi:restriction endonuclease subunit S [Thermomonas sp. LB-4]|uniref:restriction endonuclease subunit S n=1 Tax=Thermomonas sp. LB-4 TaxID=3102790 RepID=UPI002ED8AB15
MPEELCTLVPMESVSEFGQINFETRVPYEDVQSSLVSFEAGDVLFAKITPCMENGKGANVVDLPTRYAFGSTEFHVLRPRHTLDAKFLYYCTFNPVYRAFAAENMVGAAGQKRVSSRFLKDSRIFLPTVDEQQRIAGYLDASCRLIDAAVAAKRKQVDAASLIFKAILQRTITRGLANSGAFRPTGNAWLPEVPTGWGLVMLKRVCAIHGGLTLGKEYTGELVTRPYLRVANVQDGRLVLEDISTIDVPVDIAERTRLQTGDVLMTEGGDLDKLGRGVVWRGEIEGCMHQNHVFAVRCTPWKLRPQFLAYVSASQYGRDYFEATGKKTTNLAATNSTKVGQFPIPLPSISEQDEIIEYLDNEDAKARALRSSLDSQIEVLYAYRKSLIHECVTGQRRITDEDVQRVAAHAASAIA